MSDRDPPEDNEGVLKTCPEALEGKAANCPGHPEVGTIVGRAKRTEKYVSTAKRQPACRAYSAEVASATKAGSSGAGTAAPSARLRA
jgi:hypothetical protein